MRSVRQLVFLVFCLELLVWGWFELSYWNKAFPGVQILDLQLDGQTAKQIQESLKARTENFKQISLTWEDKEWKLSLSDFAGTYDIDRTVQEVLAAGRKSNWTARFLKVKLPLEYSFDVNKLDRQIASIAAIIDIPTQYPDITARFGKVSVTSGENGRIVDRQLLQKLVVNNLSQTGNLPIAIPTKDIMVKLDTDQVAEIKRRAERLLDRQLVVKLDSEFLTWTLDPVDFLPWLSSTGWHRYLVTDWVTELAAKIDRPAQNARFKYQAPGKVQEFAPGKPGIRVKQEELIDSTIIALSQLEASQKKAQVAVAVVQTQPAIKTGDVNNLGIKELIGRGESWFSHSIPNRIHNIKVASSLLDGVLLAPGDEFSFNRIVGDISARTGYKPAYVIKEGRTVLGDGGGVCQVSSTIFRAALNTGLPILDRTAHAYRVQYYEEKSELGLDATVFSPSVDFKFKNDTSAHILIQTELDEKNVHLVFNIYGTSDGRKVSLSGFKVWDVTPPPPTVYQDDPTLPVGRLVQVDWSAWGAKASFDYKVIRGDEVLQKQTFYSAFRPWRAIYLRGTRTN